MRRISVTGCSGSGKSTLCRRLAAALGAEHVELDALFHLPGWTQRPREEFRADLAARLAADAWVVDGNYESRARDLVWAAADTVVWLDLPRPLVMRQVIRRTFRRLWRREVLWNGNRERWWNLIHPVPEENIILWSFVNHPRITAKNQRAFEDLRWAHLRRVRLRGHVDIEALVAEVENQVRQSRG